MVSGNTSKSDGQPRRRLDTAKTEKEVGFDARTSLEEKLKKTIEGYTTNSKPQKGKTL